MDDIEMISEWPPVSVSPQVCTENRQLNSKSKEKMIGDEYSLPLKCLKKRNIESIGFSSSFFITRWWKTYQKSTSFSHHLCLPSSNPNTFLRYITRLPACQEYIKKVIADLLSCQSANAAMHYSLGTLYEKLNQVIRAQLHFSKALNLYPQNKEYRWHLEKIHLQLQAKNIQEQVATAISPERLVLCSFPEPLQVEKRTFESLSTEEFFQQYALTSTPVIITNLLDKIVTQPWNLQHVKEVAGSKKVTLKKFIPMSVEWAKLEDAYTTTVAEFIDGMDQEFKEEKMYLFDWSLPLHCPELASEIRIPPYFKGDFLKQTQSGSLYHDSWPSLFIAPHGIHSDLHVDAFGSNFWMALFQGRKRWVLFPSVDLPLLYPHYEHSMDPVFDVDLHNPNFEEFPLTQLAQPIECILQPGEVLFVPAGCPHRVENLDDSLAISSNFIDHSNINLVKKHLQINGLIDPASSDLYQQLETLQFPS